MPSVQELEQDLEATETALKAVRADLQKEPDVPAVVTNPDVWDEHGQLISHTAFTGV